MKAKLLYNSIADTLVIVFGEIFSRNTHGEFNYPLSRDIDDDTNELAGWTVLDFVKNYSSSISGLKHFLADQNYQLDRCASDFDLTKEEIQEIYIS